jgi:DNA polymerase-3 subunit beta
MQAGAEDAMKVTCLQENLARGLGIVGRAVSSRMSLPILTDVLLSAEGGRLRLAGTNLEIAIIAWVGAKVEEEGGIAVPARTFADFISTLPPEPVQLSVDKGTQTLRIRCGRTIANLKGNPAEEFPIIVRPNMEGALSLPAPTLREMIAQVAFAAAPDMERPILAGVLAELEHNTLSLVAADGFRLSLRREQLEQDLGAPSQVIIPARALNEVARIAAEAERPVQMAILRERSQVAFRIDSVELISQLVEGLFPDYKQIIPSSHLTRVIVSTKELQAAVRRTAVIARGANNIIRLHVLAESKEGPSRLIVSAVAADLGDNVVEVDALVEGESMRIAFNGRYLLDLLEVIKSENLMIQLSSPSSPGVFRPVGQEVEDYLHIIMPMYVQD